MGIVSFLVFGLVAGLVSRIVTPGRHAIGCLATIAVGIVGSLIGGSWATSPSATTCARLAPRAVPARGRGRRMLLLALEALAGRRRR